MRVPMKLKRVLLVSLLLYFFLMSSAVALNSVRQENYNVIEVGGEFCFEIPQRYSYLQVSTIEDFLLYRIFDKDGKFQFFIYFGNHPNTNLIDSANGEIKKIFSGLPVTKVYYEDDYSGELLIELLSGPGWPAFAHVFFSSLDASEHEFLISTVNSIRRGSGSACADTSSE